MTIGYVHGYSGDEAVRLMIRRTTLAELLHAGTRTRRAAGCWRPAAGWERRRSPARGQPGGTFISIDISAASLVQAGTAPGGRAPAGDLPAG